MGAWRFINLGLALACAPYPVFACDTAPDISQLPGETRQEAKERFEEAHSDQWAVRRYHRESYAFDKASTVYVARIQSRIDFSASVMPSVRVEPIEAIKGTLPKADRNLGIVAFGSCDNDIGDGDAAFGNVATLVVVFEGLPVSKERPNGIDSLMATSVRTFELLDPLYKHGKEIPDDVLHGTTPPNK